MPSAEQKSTKNGLSNQVFWGETTSIWGELQKKAYIRPLMSSFVAK